MASSKVFISYRRDDAAGFSHAIYDRLVEHLPRERVFMDVAGIDAGEDFTAKLENALGQCDVMIALIGKRWLGAADNAASRIHTANDWVRVEIAAALRRGIRVIPVLLDGAHLPKADALPEDLHLLPRMNAVDVRNSRMNTDVTDLIATAMTALGETWPPPEPGGRTYAALSAIYAFCVGAGVLLIMLAGMFTNEIPTHVIVALGVFMLAAAVMLRLPFHASVRTLSRQRALRTGMLVHLAAVVTLAVFEKASDGLSTVIFLGLIPAAFLYFGSHAMELKRRS